MTTTTEQSLLRPYAPPANVIAVLQRVRRMNMPAKIEREFLIGAGLTGNIISRVSQALKFLGLIDNEDVPTDAFRALANCTEDEYKQLFEQTIRTAYASDFVAIDPTVDPQQRIIDAFQRYTPKSQHSRQVLLFLGLCREAGMEVFDSPRGRQMQQNGNMKRIQKRTQGNRSTDPRTAPRQTVEVATPQSGGLLFGVTEDDIAALPPEEFEGVWSALGKVALARANAKRRQAQVLEVETQVEDDEVLEQEV